MVEQLRWGVLGARSRIYQGKIAPPLRAGARHEIVAEASRDTDGSDAPYAELLRRPDVDAVYIPLPNDGHRPWILAALEAGKHVLCEKPLTMSVADTDEVYAAANAAGRSLVEAYMWPHHPRNQLVLDLARGNLGDLRFSHASFSFPLNRPDDHRFDARGGGALFDVGIYCFGPALLLATREPVSVAASAVRNEHGVDVSLSGWLDLGAGFVSTCEVSFESVFRRSLSLVGTEGSLQLGDDMAPGPLDATEVRVLDRADDVLTRRAPGVDAYASMLDQFADVVLDGRDPVWGERESRLLARWLEGLLTAAR
jgi:D-xylose 1-dehydrogenase (NADP+, D-xylono-1,5-lactone-forming)